MIGASIALVAALTMQSTGASRTIEKGDQSDIDSPRQVVVRDAAEWRMLWQQHAPNRPLPPVDFSKESVIAIFMGSRNTAGYSVTILSTTDANGVLIVKYRETNPSPGGVAAQVLTVPYHIVAIPRTSAARVQFEKAE